MTAAMKFDSKKSSGRPEIAKNFVGFVRGVVQFCSILIVVFPMATNAQGIDDANGNDQCAIEIIERRLSVASNIMVGSSCVTPLVDAVEVCTPNAEPVVSYALYIVAEFNVLHDGRTAERTSEDCTRATISAHSLDHIGSYPNYRCTPWGLSAVFRVTYCLNE